MKEKNGSSKSQPILQQFGGKSHYRPIWLLAVVGAIYGIVVMGVLSTSPTGRTAAMYASGAFGVVGIVAGIWYGFFFNISNHCRGGRILLRENETVQQWTFKPTTGKRGTN
jgi:quinol-cytochrome oxidoreductase complex cytochrome b subunit